MTYFLTLILAFCSVVYELLLGQALSAFFGNTVLRYSVTIGLYLFAMGIGALLAFGRVRTRAVTSLQLVEVLLALIGSSSIACLFLLDYIGIPGLLLSIVAHGFIIVIGILTGLEIPLLIEIKNFETENSEGGVLGVDYLGAFIGTIAFAFIFYPYIGLTRTAFLIAAVNSLVGVMLSAYEERVTEGMERRFKTMLSLNFLLFLALVYCTINAGSINEYLLQLYLA